jgi:hypothetical protein
MWSGADNARSGVAPPEVLMCRPKEDSMTETEGKPITRQDLEALAEKLEAFAASLPTTERSLLGLAISNAARSMEKTERVDQTHFATPLSKLLAQATNFAEGRLSVPESVIKINPGKLRAKEEEEFHGFGNRR